MEGDPADINNTVTTGVAPEPGTANNSGMGSAAMSRSTSIYPGLKGSEPAGPEAGEAPPEAETAASEAGEDGPKPEAPAGEGEPAAKAEETVLSEADLANIAKLPAEEQGLAKAQKVCLITGEPLGSMGVPVRVEHEGTVGFLCCKGCQADFDADPAAAIAKVKK
jgi:hypothetical protein